MTAIEIGRVFRMLSIAELPKEIYTNADWNLFRSYIAQGVIRAGRWANHVLEIKHRAHIFSLRAEILAGPPLPAAACSIGCAG